MVKLIYNDTVVTVTSDTRNARDRDILRLVVVTECLFYVQ